MTSAESNPRRTKKLIVRLSPEELTDLQNRAEQAGLKVSTFVRSRIVLNGGEIVTDVDPLPITAKHRHRREIIRELLTVSKELAPIGNLLNQIARVANVTEEIRYRDRLNDGLTRFSSVASEISQLLRTIK